MKEETQDRLWSIPTKEERESMIDAFKSEAVNADYERGWNYAVRNIFGYHNLTSDTDHPEPKPTNGAIGTTPPASKLDVKPTPRFKCGDKVTFKDSYYKEELHGRVGVVKSIQGDCYVEVDDTIYCARESDLAPYAEPEQTKDAYEQYCDSKAAEPKQTKDMEEKELNLAELLKGCGGDTFYSPYFGTVSIINVRPEENRLCIDTQSSFGRVQLFEDGSMVGSGGCVLFPSRDLYLKYPLEAAKAWQIWAEERKPIRWIPKHGEKVWCLNVSLNPMWEINNLPSSKWVDELNCFQTEELCEQAAEAVKRTLEEFHEKNAEK